MKRFDELSPRADSLRTCRDIAHWYADNVAGQIEQLGRLSDDDLATPVAWLGLRNDPAVAYLNIAKRHSVHHRGQLSAYLRPAIYVESADEPFPPVDGSIPKQPLPAF